MQILGAVPFRARLVRGAAGRVPGRLLPALLFLVSGTLRAQEVPAIAREFRGAWVASVANIDWPSQPGLSTWEQQAELIAILNRVVALNMNAVILQVRPAADALYDSPLEPWSAYLTGVEGRPPEPYYDPLAFAVREAHARGLELHAWFNPYRARHPSARGAAARTHVSVAHPELVREYGRYLWMDPGEPAVRARTLNVMLDVVKRYDVDGIHIDDYFYPYPETGPGGAVVPFPDSASYARYRRSGGSLDRDDWRRHNVDVLIEQIYRRTKALKPWVKVGISPFGIWRPGNPEGVTGFDAFEKLYADSRRWVREGWLDYNTPQLYWPIAQVAQSYPTLLRWWMEQNVKGRHVWPGHNASRAAGTVWPPNELIDQVRLTRGAGATGDVHFSMRALMPPGVRRDSVLVGVATQPPGAAAAAQLGERVRDSLYREPALIPASPWLATRRVPAAPRITIDKHLPSGEPQLRITPGSGGPVRWWTVRLLDGAGSWHAWILPATQRSLTTPLLASRRRLIVSGVDRIGRETGSVETP